MKYPELIKAVQERAGITSREEAEEATRATLRTLGERLAGGEPHDLASQLPPELAGYVRYDEEQRAEPFSLEEFFQRVSAKEGVEEQQAIQHARAVMSTLREAITAGEFGDVRAQLPEEYAPLFQTA